MGIISIGLFGIFVDSFIDLQLGVLYIIIDVVLSIGIIRSNSFARV